MRLELREKGRLCMRQQRDETKGDKPKFRRDIGYTEKTKLTNEFNAVSSCFCKE